MFDRNRTHTTLDLRHTGEGHQASVCSLQVKRVEGVDVALERLPQLHKHQILIAHAVNRADLAPTERGIERGLDLLWADSEQSGSVAQDMHLDLGVLQLESAVHVLNHWQRFKPRLEGRSSLVEGRQIGCEQHHLEFACGRERADTNSRGILQEQPYAFDAAR